MSKHQFVTKPGWVPLAKSNHSAKQKQQQQQQQSRGSSIVLCAQIMKIPRTQTKGVETRKGRATWKAKGKGNVEGLLSFWHILMRIYNTASLAPFLSLFCSLSLSLSISLYTWNAAARGHWQLVNFNLRECKASEQARECVVSPFARAGHL